MGLIPCEAQMEPKMPAKLAESDQMTVEEFLAFYESRPDGEKWELIDGRAVVSPSATDWHQRIIANITSALDEAKIRNDASWTAMPGISTEVPVAPNSLPQPDVFVMEGGLRGSHITDDALILFEVLSKSNTKKDQAWRRRVYASVPNCQHYVTISTEDASVTRYDRANQWRGLPVDGLDAELSLPAIDVIIPLRTIYRWTPIA